MKPTKHFLAYGITISVELAALILTILMQTPDTVRLAELNRQADAHLTAYELDKADPLLDQALEIAIRLGPEAELAAHVRIANLYHDLQKRDGRDWRNLAIPQLRRAIELSKSNETTNELSVAHAIAILELPTTGGPLDLSAQFAKLLDQWIGQLEEKEGPLNPKTALPYDALTYSASGSEAELRALHACDLLMELPPPSPAFAMLLIHCAEHELHMLAEDSTRKLTRLARKAAAAGGARYAYETVLSYLVDAELDTSYGSIPAALAAIASARETATKSLSPGHELWEQIAGMEERLRPKGAAIRKGELVRRDHKPTSPRLQHAQVISRVEPVYTREARAQKFAGTVTLAVLINVEGKAQVVNVFRAAPFGMTSAVTKAVSQWTFQPWLKDGNPVPGVMVFEIPLHSPSK